MPEVVVYPPGWRDRRWKKGLKKLPPEQRERLEGTIRDLVSDLMECTHPTLDPRMQRWGPTRYHSRGKQKRYGSWYEYRLGDAKNAARAIVCHDTERQVIFLVARTVTHDHDRLSNVVAGFRG